MDDNSRIITTIEEFRKQKKLVVLLLKNTKYLSISAYVPTSNLEQGRPLKLWDIYPIMQHSRLIRDFQKRLAASKTHFEGAYVILTHERTSRAHRFPSSSASVGVY